MNSFRPVPTFALGFVPGIAAGVMFLPDPAPAAIAVVLIVCAVSALLFSVFRPHAVPVILAGLLFGLAAPAVHTGFYGGNHIRFHLDEINGPVTVTGVITETPLSRALVYRGDGNRNVPEKRASFSEKQGSGVIRIESVATPDNVTHGLHGLAGIKFYKIGKHLPVGTRIRLSGKLFRPFSKSVPGGFDYAEYLAHQKIFARFIVSSRSEIEVLGRTGLHPLADLRLALVDLVASSFGSGKSGSSARDASDFLMAILLGERRLLTDERRELYITSGTAHFLAISGLHLALFAAFLSIALRFLKRRPRVLVIGAAVALYAGLAGFRPSVFRALVMILFYLGAVYFRRQRRGLDAVAAAAILVLLVNPFDLVSAGFQLSFAGVLGIMLLAGPLENLVTKEEDRLFDRLASPEYRPTGLRLVWPFLRANLILSVCAWIAVGPLVAYHFHIVTPLAIVLSVIAILFIWVVIVGGFVALALVAVTGISAIATPILWAVESFHALIILPQPLHAYWYMGDFSAWWLAGYYFQIFMAIYRNRLPFGIPFKIKLRWAGACFALFALAFILSRLPESRPEHFELTMLDVGDMSCMVVRTPEGGVLVYDVGAKAGFSAGSSALAPYLWHEGVGGIDALVISHAQMDHYGGVEYMLDKFHVGKVYINRYFCLSGQWKVKRLIKKLAVLSIPMCVIGSGDVIDAVPGLEIRALAPTNAPPPKQKLENETSLVIKIERGNYGVLLTGDIEEYGYARLVETGADLAADMVQVPHHGYGFENAADLARASDAGVFLISNYSSRLSEKLLLPYRQAGQVVTTGESGAITVEFGAGGIEVRKFRSAEKAN
ncbi:MAG: DNA internalization-related competence protein ComEC/Rec2 [Planctomycetota bacterium]